jgi:hypothetical protein
MRDRRRAYRVLVGRPDWRPIEISRRRWEDNIRMDLQEVRWVGIDWNALAQDREGWWTFVNAVMNLRVSSNARDFWTS